MTSHIQHVNFDYRAPYYTSGKLTSDKLWFVFHGYGQLAPFFIQKFDFLEKDVLIVAPQGLSHFYLQGTSGRVGASWMTKENRQLAIQNYISYLDHIYSQLTQGMKLSSHHITVLGFSQGVSTLIRWLVYSEMEFDQLIMCAGSFPDDIDLSVSKRVFLDKPCYYLYGDQDPYIKPGSIEQLDKKFHQYGLEVDFRRFEGKHEISRDLLEELA
ncbi:alpha/beta hydrolase [Catalinimonas niigatensis]|uniref:alpha/beta hydrolase n=1 Tax=Catalinimonas niigatensis TaxID=1397264 RepID=UPI002666150E|nr:dienelactone hydrolase family protein [Catalinimonas niigatensis]WPP48898.1 dienelactone hydrolase family protein [Catalinimonas niigatensis]